MAKNIKFNVKLNVDGKAQLEAATTVVRDMHKEVTGLQSAFVVACEKFNHIGFAMSNVSGALSDVMGRINGLTAESRSFGGAMAAANTMAGKSGEEFGKLKEQVAELSETVPVARDALANGLYQVISNGVPENNWIEFLEKSAKASVGGIADLEEVVKVTSTVIKNYGLAWSDAGDIQDKIQLTAKNGVTSFEQMAQALPRVTANAATLGVSIDELMAMFSTLTGVSGNTAEVSTQLAAIFTALIKPSSEAATMAEQMGIKFNASAIKAAGGMSNFLTQLNDDVKKYTSTSGILEQEIYGKLFGSAESLRALTPLTGNLADKYQENVEAMQSSSGAIESAYTTMANTGCAKLQQLNNTLGKYTDVLQNSIGNVLPYANFTASTVTALASVVTLCNGMKNLTVAHKLASSATLAYGMFSTKTAVLTRIFSAALAGTAYSATAAKVAIKGLIVSTGVGIAVVALTSAMERLCSVSDTVAVKSGAVVEAENAYSSAAANAKVKMDDEAKQLAELIKAHKDTSSSVAHLNETYSSAFGYHKTAADWYDILTKKSQVYARQLGYEAQVRTLSAKLAEKQVLLQDNFDKRRDLWKSGGAQIIHRRGIYDSMGNKLDEHVTTEDTEAYTNLKKEAKTLLPEITALQNQLGIAERKMQECAKEVRNVGAAGRDTNRVLSVSKMSYKQVTDEIKKVTAKLSSSTTDKSTATILNSQLVRLKARKKELEKTYSGVATSNKNTKKEPKYYKNPTTDEQLSKNISYFSKQRNGKDTPEQRALIQKIALWERMRKEIELAKKAQLVPQSLNSDEDVEKALDYLKLKKELADQKDKPAIDKEIAQTELRGAELNRPADLATYQDIDKEIEYQQKRKNLASKDAVQGIQDEIDALEKLKQTRTAMDDLNDRLSKAQKNFDNATTVEAKVKAQADIQKIQKEIDTATNGKITISAEVKPTYVEEGSTEDKRQSYSNAEAKVSTIKQDYEMGIIGADEAKRELEEINTELQNIGLKPIKVDFDNSGFEKTFGKIKEGWSDIQGLESGIEGITSALDGNKHAWEAISGVINGTIQVMESISTIVKFVKDLTAATAAQTSVTNADTAASTANAAAKATETTASITNTAAKSGEAVANAAESGSKLAFPYNLVAIAAGVAAVVGALALVGTFANGGIVGGSSFTGDKLTARVNSGEMILNASQQKRLFSIANGVSVPQMSLKRYSIPKIELNSAALGTMSNQTGGQKTVKLKLEGRDLVGLIANETRINNRSGRRSNIKI